MERDRSVLKSLKIQANPFALCHDTTLENVRPVLLAETEDIPGQRNCRTQYEPRPCAKVNAIKYLDAELAATLAELESEKDLIANDPQKLEVLFREMMQMCLW